MDSFNDLISRTNIFIGEGRFDSAALVFLKALDIDSEAAWDGLWVQTPWDFFKALLPPQLARWDMLSIRSKIVSVRTLLHLRDYEYALPFIADLARLLPRHNLPFEFFARAHAGMGHFYCALRYVEHIETTSFLPEFETPAEEGDVSPLKLFKLDVLFELGDDTAFERCINEELDEKRHPDLLITKSFWLRNLGRYQEGLDIAEEALVLDRSDLSLFQRGWFRRALGDPRATDDFRAYLADSPGSAYDYYLPFIYCYLGQRHHARQAMLDYLAATPNPSNGYYLCAEIYSLLGDIPMAVDCLEQAFRNGLVSRAGLYGDPALRPLLADTEGSALIHSRLRTLEEADFRAAQKIF